MAYSFDKRILQKKCKCFESWFPKESRFSESVPRVFNYLWQPNGAAESNGFSNVVTHPEVDCVDAASHIDQLMQGFTLIHRPHEDNNKTVSFSKSN